MKRELKRIEAALHQLEDQQSSGYIAPLPSREVVAQTAPRASLDSLPVAKKISMPEVAKVSLPLLPNPLASMPQDTISEIADSGDALEPVLEPLPSHLSEVKTPNLPRLKTPSFSSHRNAANPTLAMNLLKEMETTVAGWQEELQQVLLQIQDIYLEGPIVDGWLESYAHQAGEATAFRHADIDCLMDYVEKIRSSPTQELDQSISTTCGTGGLSEGETAPGYRLCGLNEDGQLWFRHCPAEQVPSVSLAIARYQRLRLLLSRKQYLETRLGQIAETLVLVHGRLNS